MDKEPINKPFTGLPAFMEAHNMHIKPFTEDVTRTDVKDDTCLLAEAMQGVKVIDKNKKKVLNKRYARRFRQAPQEEDPRKLLEEATRRNHRFNVTNLPEFVEGFAEGINPITMEKLREGEFSVQRALDLHGYSIEDADDLFQAFVKGAVREGLKCVKVVHGRGLKSKGSPVLKEQLKKWIIRAMHRKWIIAFSNALMNDGGPGATYILLKKNPLKRRIRIIG